MSKPSNKKGFDFNAYVQKLQANRVEDDRLSDAQPERAFFLIVCEGTKTEPNYFTDFKNKLQKHLIEIEIYGKGENTLNVVNCAANLKEDREKDAILPDFAEVWAVFDKDEFPLDRVKTAFQIAESNGVSCAYSNEAFELWFLLHFIFVDTAISRQQYSEKLSEQIGKKMEKPFKYDKTRPDFFDILEKYGDQTLAIRFAKKLLSEKAAEAIAEANPVTTVFKLVEKLNEYL